MVLGGIVPGGTVYLTPPGTDICWWPPNWVVRILLEYILAEKVL